MQRRDFVKGLVATAGGGAAGFSATQSTHALGLAAGVDGCGVEPPDPATRASLSAQIQQQGWSAQSATRTQRIDIPVFFHIIHVKGQRKITQQQLTEQIRVLNADLNPHRISCSAAGGQIIEVKAIPGLRMIYERVVKPKLAKDRTKYLNFYVGPLKGGLLGYAAFPWDAKFEDRLDGVVMSDDAMPGGRHKGFNTGRVAVHELGHWLGLYHTFQDGCSGSGDDVASTPAHPKPNRGCKPKSQWPKACNGQDPVPYDNIMNYTTDQCRTTLTDEQVQRIHMMTRLFRASFVTGAKAEPGGAGSGQTSGAPSALDGGDDGGWSAITQ